MKYRVAVLFLLPFLVLGFGAWVGWKRDAAQQKRDAGQERFLNYRFGSVKLQNGRPVLIARRYFPGFDLEKATPVAPGDVWEYHDRHWTGKYTVMGADASGVILRYEYNGSSPAREGRWSGRITLHWK